MHVTRSPIVKAQQHVAVVVSCKEFRKATIIVERKVFAYKFQNEEEFVTAESVFEDENSTRVQAIYDYNVRHEIKGGENITELKPGITSSFNILGNIESNAKVQNI